MPTYHQGFGDRTVGDRARRWPSRRRPAPTRTSYGGSNLVALTADNVSSTGPDHTVTGSSTAGGGPTARNVIGQAFAARGLSVAGSPKAASATSFLLQQQCTVRASSASTSPRTRPRPSRAASRVSAGSGPDVDVTALTVLQLAAIPHQERRGHRRHRQGGDLARRPASARTARSATAPTSPTPTPTAPASRAGRWRARVSAWPPVAPAPGCRTLQVRNPAPRARRWPPRPGAIAYNKRRFDEGMAGGIAVDAESEDRWRRATTQAAPALAAALTLRERDVRRADGLPARRHPAHPHRHRRRRGRAGLPRAARASRACAG